MATKSRKWVKAECGGMLRDLAETAELVGRLPQNGDKADLVGRVISEGTRDLCSNLLEVGDDAVSWLKAEALDRSNGVKQICRLVLEGLADVNAVIAVIEESDRVGAIAKAKGLERNTLDAIADGMADRCFRLLSALDGVVKRLRVALASVMVNHSGAGFGSPLSQLIATAEMACAYAQHGTLRDVANVVRSKVAKSIRLERVMEEVAEAMLVGVEGQAAHVESISKEAWRQWRELVQSYSPCG